ncbi:MAG: DUF5816 domain-containing protein [Halobacteriaceae archaeon]
MDVQTEEGETLFIDEEDAERGSKGAFLAAYYDADLTRRYGFFCTNCRTADNAMDSMGRVKCNRCGNMRKPDEWDAAHE